MAAGLFTPTHAVDAARLFTSGFETADVPVLTGVLNTEFDWENGTVTANTVTIHSGTYAGKIITCGGTLPAVGDVSDSPEGFYHGIASHTSGTVWVRAYARFASLPASVVEFIRSVTRSSPEPDYDVRLKSGKFSLWNGQTGTTVTSTNTLSTNTWYRFEVRELINSTSGELELRVYAGESTTPIETLTITGENTGNFGQIELGCSSGTANSYFFDDSRAQRRHRHVPEFLARARQDRSPATE